MGLIKAALGAAGGVMADQWNEYSSSDYIFGVRYVNHHEHYWENRR